MLFHINKIIKIKFNNNFIYQKTSKLFTVNKPSKIYYNNIKNGK